MQVEKLTAVFEWKHDASGADAAITKRKQLADVDKASAGSEMATAAQRQKAGETVAKGAVVGAAAVGAAAAGMVASGVKTAMEFDAIMSSVGAKSGATAAEMTTLNAQALQLGKDTVFSAKEVGQAYDMMASSGFTATEQMAAVPGVLSLAAAGQIELSSASQITSQTLRGMGMEADQATRVSNVLANASLKTGATVENLGGGMAYAAPLAKSFGINLETTSASLGILNRAGIVGTRAGTAMVAVLGGMNNQGKPARAALDALGVSAFDSAGKFRGLPVVLKDFNKALASKSLEEGNAALGAIFGKSNIASFRVLLGQTGDEVGVLADQLKNSAGVADTVAAKKMDNLKGVFTALGGSVETIGIVIGQALTPAIKAVAEWATKLANKFLEMTPGQQKAIAMFLALTAGIGLTVGAIGAAYFVMAPLITAIGTLSGVTGGLAGVTKLAGGAWKAANGGLLSMGKSAVSALNPMSALKATTGGMKAVFSGGFSGALGAAKTAILGIGPAAMSGAAGLATLLGPITAVALVVGGMFMAVRASNKAYADQFAAAHKAGGSLVSYMTAAKKARTQSGVLAGAGFMLKEVWHGLGNVFRDFKKFAQPAVDAFKKIAGAIYQLSPLKPIVEAISSAAEWLGKKMGMVGGESASVRDATRAWLEMEKGITPATLATDAFAARQEDLTTKLDEGTITSQQYADQMLTAANRIGMAEGTATPKVVEGQTKQQGAMALTGDEAEDMANRVAGASQDSTDALMAGSEDSVSSLEDEQIGLGDTADTAEDAMPRVSAAALAGAADVVAAGDDVSGAADGMSDSMADVPEQVTTSFGVATGKVDEFGEAVYTTGTKANGLGVAVTKGGEAAAAGLAAPTAQADAMKESLLAAGMSAEDVQAMMEDSASASADALDDGTAAADDLGGSLDDLPTSVKTSYQLTGGAQAHVTLLQLQKDLKAVVGAYTLSITGKYIPTSKPMQQGQSLRLQHDVEDALSAADPGLNIYGRYYGGGLMREKDGTLALTSELGGIEALTKGPKVVRVGVWIDNDLTGIKKWLENPAIGGVLSTQVNAELARIQTKIDELEQAAQGLETAADRPLQKFNDRLRSILVGPYDAPGSLAWMFKEVQSAGAQMDLGAIFENMNLPVQVSTFQEFYDLLQSMGDEPERQSALWKVFYDELMKQEDVRIQGVLKNLNTQLEALQKLDAERQEKMQAGGGTATFVANPEIEKLQQEIERVSKIHDEIKSKLADQDADVDRQLSGWQRIQEEIKRIRDVQGELTAQQEELIKQAIDYLKAEQDELTSLETETHDRVMGRLDEESETRDRMHQDELDAIELERSAATAANDAIKAQLEEQKRLIDERMQAADDLLNAMKRTKEGRELELNIAADEKALDAQKGALEMATAAAEELKSTLTDLYEVEMDPRKDNERKREEMRQKVQLNRDPKVAAKQKEELQGALDSGQITDPRDRRQVQLLMMGKRMRKTEMDRIIAGIIGKADEKVDEASNAVSQTERIIQAKKDELDLMQRAIDLQEYENNQLKDKLDLESRALDEIGRRQDARYAAAIAAIDLQKQAEDNRYSAEQTAIETLRKQEQARYEARITQIEQLYALEMLRMGKSEEEVQAILARQREMADKVATESAARYTELIAGVAKEAQTLEEAQKAREAAAAERHKTELQRQISELIGMMVGADDATKKVLQEIIDRLQKELGVGVTGRTEGPVAGSPVVPAPGGGIGTPFDPSNPTPPPALPPGTPPIAPPVPPPADPAGMKSFSSAMAAFSDAFAPSGAGATIAPQSLNLTMPEGMASPGSFELNGDLIVVNSADIPPELMRVLRGLSAGRSGRGGRTGP